MLSVAVYAAVVSLIVAEAVVKSSPKAIGPCIMNRCPRGYKCTDAECVPDPDLIEELGPCVNNLCPESYQCNDAVCIRPIRKVRVDSVPIGPCVNEKCPERYLCVMGDYRCYPIEE